MKKDISLKVEIFSGAEFEQHSITLAKEVEFVLRHIVEKKSRVALYYNAVDDFILTTLLHVDDTGLWLEQSPHSPVNRQICDSGTLIFVSDHHQVKVQFVAEYAGDAEHQGYRAFYLPLPDSIYRQQRREHYRMMAPVSKPLICVVAGRPPQQKPSAYVIVDISCGGIALTCAETDSGLELGAIYPDCQIDLPDRGTIKVVIEVINLSVVVSASGRTHIHAGCKFNQIEGRYSILLQRYVTDMQRAKAESD